MGSTKILLVSGFAVLTAGALSIRGTVTSPKQRELLNTALHRPVLVADGSDPLPRPNPPTFA